MVPLRASESVAVITAGLRSRRTRSSAPTSIVDVGVCGGEGADGDTGVVTESSRVISAARAGVKDVAAVWKLPLAWPPVTGLVRDGDTDALVLAGTPGVNAAAALTGRVRLTAVVSGVPDGASRCPDVEVARRLAESSLLNCETTDARALAPTDGPEFGDDGERTLPVLATPPDGFPPAPSVGDELGVLEVPPESAGAADATPPAPPAMSIPTPIAKATNPAWATRFAEYTYISPGEIVERHASATNQSKLAYLTIRNGSRAHC
jgi:hypothetical protein